MTVSVKDKATSKAQHITIQWEVAKEAQLRRQKDQKTTNLIHTKDNLQYREEPEQVQREDPIWSSLGDKSTVVDLKKAMTCDNIRGMRA